MKAKSWDGESTACTAPHCRTDVLFGQGLQFVDENGELQRYCWTSWKKREVDREVIPGSNPTPNP